MRTEAPVTPAEKVARYNRARQLATGEVRIPLACPTCFSTRISTQEDGRPFCDACGRETTEKTVHTIRRQRIARFLRTGDQT